MKRGEFIKEFRGKSDDELKDKSRELAEELMKLRFQKASGRLEQSHQIQTVKRNLARIETLRKQQQDAATNE